LPLPDAHQKAQGVHNKKDVSWRFHLTVRNLASFESSVKEKAAVNACVGMLLIFIKHILTWVFALLNLTDDGLCESLEPWERVTRFPRFSFLGQPCWGVGGTINVEWW
jgi:hypothetical protein